MPPDHPIVITGVDATHTVHAHPGDRLLLVVFGIASVASNDVVTLDHPDVLERLTDDPQAHGDQIVVRALRRGTAGITFFPGGLRRSNPFKVIVEVD